ncbi:hypothetical protein VCRA2119O48_110123 [Vibrio crassostreae]|nr:hypothetical protein VCRA2119O48_110123 [Vibrio crassostreae]CAK3908547.1 hypothetical protein VCRA212O16_330064 [Vibrio crassostreae]
MSVRLKNGSEGTSMPDNEFYAPCVSDPSRLNPRACDSSPKPPTKVGGSLYSFDVFPTSPLFSSQSS